MHTSLSRELSQAIALLDSHLEALTQDLTAELKRHPQTLGFAETDPKQLASDYYLLSAKIADLLKKSDNAVSHISQLLLRADQAVSPELVGLCDTVLGAYIEFRKALSISLQEGDRYIRTHTEHPSVAHLHGTSRSMIRQTVTLQDTLRSALSTL